MSGIYVHIPFCKKRCTYCSFYSTTLLNHIDHYIDSICKEAFQRKDFLTDKNIETLYIGGGTPSLLHHSHIEKIYDTLASVYNLDKLREFTIECNPDDVDFSFISGLKKTAVNRVSLGVQSFDDTLLKFMNRRHDSLSATEAVKRLQENGYDNISFDLIYGIPGQSEASWKESVEQAISLNVQHISAYNLSFEEGTPMFKYADKAPDDDTCLDMFKHLCSQLSKAGFEHYEISNFARKGFRSKHNSSYWTGVPYLGLGAGAHSYNTKERHWNNEMVISGNTINWNTEKEVLSERDIFNELILTSLRTIEGVPESKVNIKYTDHFNRITEKKISEGLLKKHDGRVSLTEKGIFLSDAVIRDFIIL